MQKTNKVKTSNWFRNILFVLLSSIVSMIYYDFICSTCSRYAFDYSAALGYGLFPIDKNQQTNILSVNQE